MSELQQYKRDLLNNFHVNIIILIFLGFSGNYLRLPLFFGLDFIFGSIATVMVIRLYGKGWGILAGFMVSSYTFILWNHPYAIIIFTCEAVFLAVFFSRTKYNLLLLDGIYWLLFGFPLIWIFYNQILMMDWLATILLMLKQSLNGIFNVLVANLILDFSPFKKWLTSGNDKTISLQQILFNLLISFILIPMLILVAFIGRQEFRDIKDDVKVLGENTSENISTHIQYWYNQQLAPLKELAGKAALSDMTFSQDLQEDLALIKNSFPSFHNLYVANQEATAIAFYPEKNEQGQITIGLNFADRIYYQKLKSQLDSYVSDVFMGRGGVFSPIITIGVPVVKDGQFSGYVMGALDLDYISNLIKSIEDHNNFKVTILDRQKNVIASTDNTVEVLDRYEKIKSLEKEQTFYHWQPADKTLPAMERWKKSSYIYFNHFTNRLPWSLVVEIPVAYYQNQLYQVYLKILATAFVVTILALFLAYSLSRWLIMPLEKLTQATRTLPSQFANTEKTRLMDTKQYRVSEIVSLFNNFKVMEDTLKEMFRKVKSKEKALEYLAYHDVLTRLPNRIFFNKRLTELIQKEDKQQFLAIMFVDLDNFKKINDGFGHKLGDILLKTVAIRLTNICDKKDFVARQGGDEFVIILTGVSNEQEVQKAAAKIVQEIAEPFLTNGYEFFITTSIGISLYPSDGKDVHSLIKNADIAMYSAKYLGKNCFQFFNSNMLKTISKNLELESGLRKALEGEQFLIYLQPQVAANTGEIVSAEALLRWKHPVLGFISPADFIPLAEETGLIIPIGKWMLKTVCSQIRAWQTTGYTPIPISVNISMHELMHREFVNYVIELLEEYEFDPSYLRIEITESTAMKNADVVTKKLRKLRNLGVKIALDDFGKGYSSLNYLKVLPIDILKIDKSFIDSIDNSKQNNTIIEAVINIAHSLQLKVIAEGVEDEEQLAYLKAKKCDLIQGYITGYPLTTANFTRKFLQD